KIRLRTRRASRKPSRNNDGRRSMAQDTAIATAIAPQHGKHVWRGGVLATQTDWIKAFPPGAIDELKRAVAHAPAHRRDSTPMNIDGHRLPSLAALAADIKVELADGYGFCLLRDAPIESLSVDELKMMLLILGNHLGLIGPQEDRPRSIGEVMDTGPNM